MKSSDLFLYWNSLSRLNQRLVLAFLFGSEAIIGLLYQKGFLNLIDLFVSSSFPPDGTIPPDFNWLLQTFQLICVGFFFIKILFEDVKSSKTRTFLMCVSPFLLLGHVLLSLHILLYGLGRDAEITFSLGQLTISTLTWSSTYLAIAVGCTLTYSVQRYGNFAQSEFFMLGMYVAIAFMWTDWLFPLTEAPADGTLVWSLFFYVVIGSFFLTGLAGIIIDRLVFKGFRESKSSPDVMMIASLGVAMIMRALVYLRFGSNSKRFVPDKDWMDSEQHWELPSYSAEFNLGISEWPIIEYGTTNYAYNNAFLPVLVFISVFLLVLLLNYTRLGRRMRAVADNPDLAASSGINVERVQMTSAFLSAGISGLGGAIFGLTVLFSPQTAFTLLLPAFAVIVLGTIGSVPGAIVASLIIGFVRAVSEPVLSGIGNESALDRSNYFALGAVTPYAIIIAILMIMPSGIGKAYEDWNIERIRNRAASRKVPNNQTSAKWGVLFGWAGAHHFHQGRGSRGVSMLVLTLSAFVLGKSLSFIRNNSFAGEDKVSVPEGLGASYHGDWLNLIEKEQTVIGILGFLGDFLWPWVPIFIWFFACYESYLIANGKYKDLLSEPTLRLNNFIDNTSLRISELVENNIAKVSSGIHDSYFSGFLDDFSAFITKYTEMFKQKTNKISSTFFEKIGAKHGVESERGSKVMFWIYLSILVCIIVWLPTVGRYEKVSQISIVLVTISIFLLLAFSLNIHTGMTGLVNFGVIFFASIGAIIVGILTAPDSLYGYNWDIFPAVVVAMIVSAVLGYLLAYPTARLRSDYFAIITISLGEMVRILLSGEPLLRAGGNYSAIGIQRYPLPFRDWWFCGSESQLETSGSAIECSLDKDIDSMAWTVGELMGLDRAAPYMLVLAVIGTISALIVWKLLDMLFRSPWGRILRSIREDEEVAQHHGHDILTHKARSLALGAAIAALAGALWAWKLTGFQPTFMSPAKSTFLVWAAFIIGGAGNNKGMVIGATIIALTNFVFGVLVAAQGSSSLPLHEQALFINEKYIWMITAPLEVAGIFLFFSVITFIFNKYNVAENLFWFSFIFIVCEVIFDPRSVGEVFPEALGGVKIQMNYLKLLLIGALITLSLKYNPKGLLPEVPYRPERPIGIGSDIGKTAIAAIPDYEESSDEEEVIQDE